jgi:integrase/recombinase XerD
LRLTYHLIIRGELLRLKLLSQFLANKPFNEMTKENILAFLYSIRKPETKDPTHKWIGTYNQRLINLLRFFNAFSLYPF